MNVVRLDAHRTACSHDARGYDRPDRVETLQETLRMHEQMLSCLHFVREQAMRLHGGAASPDPVLASIEMVEAKRAEFTAQLAELGHSPDPACD